MRTEHPPAADPDQQGQDRIWDYFQNDAIDSFSLSRGRLDYLLSKLSAGSRVLNIGVGGGIFEQLAIRQGIEIWSLDPSERAILRLRDSLGMGDRARVGHGQNMPFETGQFDAVVMSEVLEHLDDEVLAQTLAEVSRILKPGGAFIGTVPADERLADSSVVCPHCAHQFHRWGHRRSFDTAGMHRLLSTRFRPEEVYTVFFIDWRGASLKRKLKGLLQKLLSHYRIGTYGTHRNIFFRARKTVS